MLDYGCFDYFTRLVTKHQTFRIHTERFQFNRVYPTLIRTERKSGQHVEMANTKGYCLGLIAKLKNQGRWDRKHIENSVYSWEVFFELGVVSSSEEFERRFFKIGEEEIERIEVLLSEFRDDSLTSRTNNKAALFDRPTTPEIQL